MNLGLLSQVGYPTCLRLQGSSVIDLTWGTPAAGVRLSDWRVDEAEFLLDHLNVRFSYSHESTGVRNSRPQHKKPPRWKVNYLDEDYLIATLISEEWTGGTLCEGSVAGADCADRGQTRGSKSTYWWSDDVTNLSDVAMTIVRKLSRARKKKNREEIVRCQDARRDARRALTRAIKEAKKNSWRDLLNSIEDDPWDRSYKLVLGKLRPYAQPVTETLEDRILENILSKLFPRGPGTELLEPLLSQVTISAEEVLVVARKGKGGRLLDWMRYRVWLWVLRRHTVRKGWRSASPHASRQRGR
ncbi:uncharacterized protein LOC118449638 [Vespa mandarinia]|uniref:uncharacterized protein LOC118449638 n=1 Tax=Vespa mandarinia TaxID=7446 RepID=UPI00162196B0|nr:uncharacterized protein LOC118449638 [Vespa mandarinia]